MEPRARALALRDPAATPELVERLSRDLDAGVRRKAAYDPRVPVPRLLELLADPTTEMAAAANPALPPAEMYPGPGGHPPLNRAARRSVTYRQRVSTSRAKTTTLPS